jgi:hypothetical protein
MLFPISYVPKGTSCRPLAAKATNETYTSKLLAGLNPNNHSSIIVNHFKAGLR